MKNRLVNLLKKNKVLFICIFSIIINVAILYSVPFLANYSKFCKSKEKVNNYMAENFDTECQLIKSKIGKNAWPADRQEDVFLFYDKTNDIYFQVFCQKDYIYDTYYDSYFGKEVSDKVKNKFSTEDYKYYIRCFGEKASSYYLTQCQLFIIAENQNDLLKSYEMVSYMKNEFHDLYLTLIIVPASEEKHIVSIFEYKWKNSFDELKSFYNKRLELNDNLFTSFESFKKLLAEPDQYK